MGQDYGAEWLKPSFAANETAKYDRFLSIRIPGSQPHDGLGNIGLVCAEPSPVAVGPETGALAPRRSLRTEHPPACQLKKPSHCGTDHSGLLGGGVGGARSCRLGNRQEHVRHAVVG